MLAGLLVAALASTPEVQQRGCGAGGFTTAALLHAGVAVVGALPLTTAAEVARVQISTTDCRVARSISVCLRLTRDMCAPSSSRVSCGR